MEALTDTYMPFMIKLGSVTPQFIENVNFILPRFDFKLNRRTYVGSDIHMTLLWFETPCIFISNLKTELLKLMKINLYISYLGYFPIYFSTALCITLSVHLHTRANTELERDCG